MTADEMETLGPELAAQLDLERKCMATWDVQQLRSRARELTMLLGAAFDELAKRSTWIDPECRPVDHREEP